MAKGEQLNNVSARLTDDEYNKAVIIQEKYSKITRKKHSLADILRIGIEQLYNAEMKIGPNMTTVIKQQLEEMQAYQEQQNSTNTVKIGLSESPETIRKTENPITTHEETSHSTIEEQIQQYADSLKGTINPETEKNYTQAQIKKLVDEKRKDLTAK